jgi:hypothetical protein
MTPEEAKLWTDSPNPITAEAERILYLPMARALERMLREIAKITGLPVEEAVQQEAGPK